MMRSENEARDTARGLIDIELGLVYSRAEADLDFVIGADEDPLVQRLGRAEFERRRAEAEGLFRSRFPGRSEIE